MTDDDIHVRDFARVLTALQPHLPISDQYELDCTQKQGVWWQSSSLPSGWTRRSPSGATSPVERGSEKRVSWPAPAGPGVL